MMGSREDEGDRLTGGLAEPISSQVEGERLNKILWK
jgi:hypothetical protein